MIPGGSSIVRFDPTGTELGEQIGIEYLGGSGSLSDLVWTDDAFALAWRDYAFDWIYWPVQYAWVSYCE